MLTYTEMYPPAARPWVESITSINVGLAETFLVMINGWHGVYQEMSKNLIGPTGLDAVVPTSQQSDGKPDAPATPEPREASQPQALQEQVEAVPDQMPRNAALAILTNPALAAGAAARDGADDEGEEGDESDVEAEEIDEDAEDAVDVRDDTSDDIAEEIEREAAEEAASLPPELTDDVGDVGDVGDAIPANPTARGGMPSASP